jgi:two-component system, NarL family, nitrate/nitrite response regulator NarL
MRCTSVIIADCRPGILHGLKSLLGTKSDFRIVACCSDGTSCMEAIRNLTPDIAVLDVALPRMTGLEILATANAECIPTRLVFFVESIKSGDLVIPAAAAGAYAVITKDAAPEVLVKSLQQVADGQILLPPPTSDQAARELGAVTELAPKMLTDREYQIMRLVSQGLSNKEIGRRLNVADGTVKVHLHHIFRKLDVSNRTTLATLANAMSANEVAIYL